VIKNTIILVLLFYGFIFPQSEINTFEKSAFAISYINSSEKNGLEDYWEIQNGFGGYFQTQFYIGEISVGVSLFTFKGLKGKHNNFSSSYIYFSWIGVLKMPLNSSLGAGIKVGTYLMTFSGDTLSIFQKQESELAVSPYAIFSIQVFDPISLNLSGEFITVFTHRPMKFFNISAGVSYAFTTPNWLKRLFK